MSEALRVLALFFFQRLISSSPAVDGMCYTSPMHSFLLFIRKQGVVGLATGFILGGAVSKLVSAIVTDVANPLMGIVLGQVKGLSEASVTVAGAKILWGDLVNVATDFIVIALVVFLFVHFLGFDRIDHKE